MKNKEEKKVKDRVPITEEVMNNMRLWMENMTNILLIMRIYVKLCNFCYVILYILSIFCLPIN